MEIREKGNRIFEVELKLVVTVEAKDAAEAAAICKSNGYAPSIPVAEYLTCKKVETSIVDVRDVAKGEKPF